MTLEEFSNLEIWRPPTRSFNTLFMETISEILLQRVEKLENENKEIKEILIMFINHIRSDGDLRQFSFEEKERMVKIGNKWLNPEDEEDKHMKFLRDIIDPGELIPSNATNGNIIMAMFPNNRTDIVQNKVYFYTHIDGDEDFDKFAIFDLDWWNRKYEERQDDKI